MFKKMQQKLREIEMKLISYKKIVKKTMMMPFLYYNKLKNL